MSVRLSVGILAGGRSTRMGQDKALLQWESERFIDRICGEMKGFSQVLISVAKKGDHADLGFPVVCDERRDIGPMEGIYQILSHAEEEYVFICAADMPFIKKELVEYMAEFISSDYDCYCLVDEDHIHPLCAIYSKAMLETIEKQIESGHYRLLNVLRAVRTKYIRLETSCFDKKIVRNVNTREEYAKLSLPLVFAVSGVKDAGKTGLIIKLINEFIGEGLSVAVIKHDGHEYVMDHEGTDTYRFREAGAVCSAIFSDTQYSVNHKGRASVEEMIARCGDADVVILEGMKDSAYPKVEVVRKARSSVPVCDPDSLICIATDVVSPEDVQCPVFGMDDIQGIFLCVKKYFAYGDNP
ncbi:MAG: molybdopterin-guanine dinucleotide biosynthesis protein B [Clostridium sp.]|nr:molybdopterin-guanine dinucleotide biosynthesis protein B [Acetatifactor muris]MCM1527346.1 molybdopterin-guanine dinucleotide biosynthesis protein B [Bacteroides sp.]MCM1563625.1 molybdopterin-guanine dinucleotide biosynthesis protein B [Clostridium sp.]